ncbi:uncharacterized protein LOC125757905 [Rhipicephalus sanguineus]|uniref:uncharacterized protein LOC125757905 n=1 Tax=Rhipicephalus sanguineus TaxID=34632 RepID=UPI0020C39D27|nr:uncharacterized protein LOC125757905 [Rhipicephalus sanguineus]
MAVSTLSLTGYDPEDMTWTTIAVSESQNTAETPIYRNQALNEAIARRRAQASSAPSATAEENQAPAKRAAGPKNKKTVTANWKPRRLPKPGPDEFVIVLKPREHVSLRQSFSENRYGAALTAYLGHEVAKTVTILPSHEQNLIVVHTPNPAAADRLLGDININASSGAIPLYGYLRRNEGEEVCYGVITVNDTDTTETLQQQVQWRKGNIVEIRKFGTSNKARLTFAGKEKPRFVHYENMLIPVGRYYRTIPACSTCATVGHRADTCPGIKPDTCGVCRQQVPMVEGVRVPHECQPRCSVCDGEHVTNSRECAAKFRTRKDGTADGKKNSKDRKGDNRHPSLPNKSSNNGVSDGNPMPSSNKTEKCQTAQQQPLQPQRGAAEQKTSTQPSGGAARAWANVAKHGAQVGGPGGAASSSPFPLHNSSPPITRSVEKAKIANLENQIELLLKKIATLESRQSVSPTPTDKGMENDRMESKSEVSLGAELEARLATRKCPYCGEGSSDIFHMVWACQLTPDLPPLPHPTREDWEAALLDCSDLASQKALVTRARVAATANGLL